MEKKTHVRNYIEDYKNSGNTHQLMTMGIKEIEKDSHSLYVPKTNTRAHRQKVGKL